MDGGGRSTPAVEMSDLEAQLAKRDKEIAHLKAVNEKQTRNAFASEAEFERKLDAAEAAEKEAKQATREAKEKAAEQEETLKRKIKATKKKVEKERELVEAKDAELVRFTQKLQDVMNLLDAEREEKASLTASTSQTERVTAKTAKLEAQLEKAHGQIDELARTLERERATAAARHADLAAEMAAVQKASAKVEAIAKQQKGQDE